MIRQRGLKSLSADLPLGDVPVEEDAAVHRHRPRLPSRLPPGAAGHQPNLSLQYNSGLGSGHLGIGWTLPLAHIKRQTDKGQPQYDDRSDPLLYSNGEELVPLEAGT